MQPIPVNRYLVPDRKLSAPDGFSRIDSPLKNGVPHAIGLSATDRLLVIVPTGLAAAWRDADPSTIVSEAAPEVTPAPASSPLALASLTRLPVRLLLQTNQRTIAAAPAVAGSIQSVPETEGTATALQLVVLDWRLHAGTLRSAGDYGSFVSIAWRPADTAVNEFSDPPLNPVFVKRQPPSKRLESWLVPVEYRLFERFDPRGARKLIR